MKILCTILLVAALAAAPLEAVSATRVTVAATATVIFTARGGVSKVLIRNPTAVSVYIGGSGVTTATGFEIAAGDAVSVALEKQEAIYGIVASGTAIVHVLEGVYP